jgi:DNA mismatch repair protein MutS2
MNSEPVLEFEALRALLGRYVRSALGRGELERVDPSNDRDAIKTALAETAEGIEYLRAAAQPQAASRGAAIRISFTDIADPVEAVARLRI